MTIIILIDKGGQMIEKQGMEGLVFLIVMNYFWVIYKSHHKYDFVRKTELLETWREHAPNRKCRIWYLNHMEITKQIGKSLPLDN